MPVTLTKDIADGAENSFRLDFRFGGQAFYGTRVFMAEGLTDGSTNQAATALARALATAGLPQIGTNPYPEDLTVAPNSVVLNYRSRGVPGVDDAVLLYADYDTPQLPVTPTLFTISDDTSLLGIQTQLFPGTFQPLSFSWLDPALAAQAAVSLGGEPAVGEKDTATMSFQLPLRKVVMTGPVYNQDLDGFRNRVGYVNEDAWRGKRPGQWLFTRFVSSVDQQASVFSQNPASFTSPVNGPINRAVLASIVQNPALPYQVSAEVLGKTNDEDWRSSAVFRSTHLGKWVVVPPDVVLAAVSAPYQYGIQRYNGLITAGLYRPTPFAALFGP